MERGRTLSRITLAKGSGANFRGRKSNSLMNLCGKATQKFKKYFFIYFIYHLLGDFFLRFILFNLFLRYLLVDGFILYFFNHLFLLFLV